MKKQIQICNFNDSNMDERSFLAGYLYGVAEGDSFKWLETWIDIEASGLADPTGGGLFRFINMLSFAFTHMEALPIVNDWDEVRWLLRDSACKILFGRPVDPRIQGFRG